MVFKVQTDFYTTAPLNLKEVFRYSGARTGDQTLKELIFDCVRESEKENAVNYSVCFAETPLTINDGLCDFSAFIVNSKNLAALMHGAKFAIVFACTIGIGIDRLIKKYSETNPSRALIFQALGAERIETFTDTFLKNYQTSHGVSLTPRFSAGYGDLNLAVLKDIFALLNPQKRIGLTLNDSLIMSPSKSVTAIAGINGTCTDSKKCENCNYNKDKESCSFAVHFFPPQNYQPFSCSQSHT